MPEERKVYRRPARTAAPAPQAGQAAPRPDAPPPPKKKKRPGAKRRRSRLVLGLCLLCLLVVVVVSVVLVRCSAEEAGPAEADFGTPAAAWQKNDLGYYFNTSGRAMPAAVLKGMDVSKFQGEIDWEAVAASGVEFAMIRAGYRGYGEAGTLREDLFFQANMDGALANGIAVGVYFFSQALNAEEAVEEAAFLLELLEPYGPGALALPVYFDWEDITHDTARTNGLDGEIITDCALAFTDAMEAAGYAAGVYAYRYLGYFQYDLTRLAGLSLWIGAVGDWPDFYYAHELWQYSIEGDLPGIDGNVDLDLRFERIEAEGAEVS